MHILVCLKVDPLPLPYHYYCTVLYLFFLVELEKKYLQENGSSVWKVRLLNKLYVHLRGNYSPMTFIVQHVNILQDYFQDL